MQVPMEAEALLLRHEVMPRLAEIHVMLQAQTPQTEDTTAPDMTAGFEQVDAARSVCSGRCVLLQYCNPMRSLEPFEVDLRTSFNQNTTSLP